MAALAHRVPGIRVTGIAAGLHAVRELPAGTERSVTRAAALQGLALEGLDHFRCADADAAADGAVPRDGLVVGCGTPPDHDWPGSVDALCRVLRAGAPGTPAAVT